MRLREVMAELRYHWGDVYEFAVVGDRYTATAKFGSRDQLSADRPEELGAMVRRHYRPDLLQERCST
jgi:hypothetical protein